MIPWRARWIWMLLIVSSILADLGRSQGGGYDYGDHVSDDRAFQLRLRSMLWVFSKERPC